MTRMFPLLCLLAFATAADAAQTIHHHLNLESPSDHRVQVESTFPTGSGPLELMMATWTPGSYLIREFSRQIEGMEAIGADGRRLDVRQTAKNRWQIRGGGSSVTIRYTVYAREMSVRTSFVDSELALLNPVTLVMVPTGKLNASHRLQLSLPEGWRAISALARQGEFFVAEDFDELVDSPLVAGRPEVSSFRVAGTTHYLVQLGDSQWWDLDRAAEDLAAMVSRQFLFWGEMPYSEPYFFFNLITEGRGGLEHQRSTVMMTTRAAQRTRETYLDWLGLASHELFHAWNVKEFRPKPLVEYDYEDENYTRELWFAEGLTSYYAPLMLSRAGLMAPAEYYKSLAKRIRELELKPGREVRSLEQASFDAWIKHYRPDENSINSTVSYYNKGAVVGFLLDAEIRRLSEGEHSLDDLMRKMRSRFSKRGFSARDIRDLAKSFAGQDMDDWFDRYVSGTEPLDYEPALHYFGLELITEDEIDAEADSATVDAPRSTLGAVVEPDQGRLIVKEVPRGTPADLAGVNAEDEILAIAGVRVLPEDWGDRFAQLRIGETVEVLVSRRGTVQSLSATLDAEPAEEWQIKDTGASSAVFRERLADWLGRGWYPALN